MSKYASVGITIFTAALYVLGLTFYQGFLNELGIEESLFPMPIDRTLFYGFVASANMSSKAAMWFFLAAEGTVLFALIGSFVGKILKRNKFFTTSSVSEGDEKNDVENSSFYNFSKKMFTISILFLFGFIGIFLILFASGKAGREVAVKFKQSIENSLIIPVSINFKKSAQVIKAFPIVCNEYQCSYYTKTGKTLVFNLDDIESIER